MVETAEVPQPGLRVGVFHSCTEKTLLLFGYGVYEGESVPPEDIIIPGQGPVGMFGIPACKLRLDDGSVIWGGEAWWYAEPTVQGWAKGRQVIHPKIASVREKIRAAWDKANKDLEGLEEALP